MKKFVESSLILKDLDSGILRIFADLSRTEYFSVLEDFCKKEIIRKNQILDLPFTDAKKLATEVAVRRGGIYSIKVLLDVIKGSQIELNKRKED